MERLIGYSGRTAHFTIDQEDADRLKNLDEFLPSGITFTIEPSNNENPLRNNRQHLYLSSKEVFDIQSVKKAIVGRLNN